MQKYSVAIVEDEVEILNILANLLEEEGAYTVTSFSDPREAYEKLKSNPPDVLLTDIAMPGMTGLELIAALREKIPDLPVVILSAYVDFKHVLKALRLGATDILEKPYKESRVLEVVAVAAELGRIRKKIIQLISATDEASSKEILSELVKTQALLSARSFGND